MTMHASTSPDSPLRSALRSLDAATGPLSAAEQQRSEATLERILGTPVTSQTPGSSRRSAAAVARRPRRPLLLPLAVGALVAGGLMYDRGGDDMAYVSWTASPTPLTPSEIDAVAPECRDQLRGGSLDLDKARVALAERRGNWVMLLYRTEEPDMSGSCLARNRRGSSEVDDVAAAIGGGSGPALKAPPRGFTEGAIAQYQEASVTDGAAGEQVTAVTIRAGNLTVHASVRGGRYVAWWPGPAFPDEPPQPSGKGGPEPILRYDLTLTDGTVIRDAQPTRPA